MKFVTALLLSALVAYAAHLFATQTPWWLFMVGAFLVGVLVPQAAWKNMLAVFIAVAAVWGYLMYVANAANDGRLAEKMATIIPLNGSIPLLATVSGMVGALAAALAALTGSFLRKKAS